MKTLLIAALLMLAGTAGAEETDIPRSDEIVAMCHELNESVRKDISELAEEVTKDEPDEEQSAILFGSITGKAEAAMIIGCQCTD